MDTGEAGVAGAGIERVVSTRNDCSAKRQQVVEKGLSCLKRVVRATTAGREGLQVLYRGDVEGQQQQQGWWRRDIRDSRGYGARPGAGGGSSNSMKAGGSGEAKETGAIGKAVGATAAAGRLAVEGQGWLERVSEECQQEGGL